jgi:hypothetical protein
MSKEDYLSICAKHYDALESLKSKDNFYDYEAGLERILNDSGRQYLESFLNEKSLTENRRKKKHDPQDTGIYPSSKAIHTCPGITMVLLSAPACRN